MCRIGLVTEWGGPPFGLIKVRHGPPIPPILGSPEYRLDYTEIRLAECFEHTIVYPNEKGKLLKFEMVLRN